MSKKELTELGKKCIADSIARNITSIKGQNAFRVAAGLDLLEIPEEKRKDEMEEILLLFSLRKDKEAIQGIAEHLLNKYCFKTLSGTKADKIFIYEGGIFNVRGRDVIRRELEGLLKAKCTSYLIREVTNKIAVKTLIEKGEFNTDEKLICLNNGIFDLKTNELKPHSEEIIFFSKIPVDYNPSAKCPNIEKFMQDSFYEEDIKTAWEWIGFQLYRRYFIKKAVIHSGEADTGKSTFLHLLGRFMGKDNLSGVSLQKITKNDFARKSLYLKHSNICDDLSAEDIEDTGSFKMATGGGIMGAEEKFGDDFTFVNFAKFTFACNKIPSTKEVDDNAYYGRFMIFRHDNIITEKDNFLIDKLTTEEELSGMLNFALEELKGLLEKGDFSYIKTPEEVKAIMQRSGNPLVSFAQDSLFEDDSLWISKQELYDSYINYVAKAKLPRMSKDKFCKNITKYCRYLIDARDKTGVQRGWRGVRVGGLKSINPFFDKS